MAFKEGDIVQVNYTGRTAEGTVFDTTREKDAIGAGVFDKDKAYAPLTVVVGSKEILPKLEEAITAMGAGDSKKVALKAPDAFGERKADAVRMVPLRAFRERDMNPVPGLVVEINDARGRVQAVSGGRVRVDFNHPLAGQDVSFEVKVEKVLTAPGEKASAFAQKFFPKVPEKERTVTLKEKVLRVSLPAKYSLAAGQSKALLADAAVKHLGVEKVVFEETLEKKDLKAQRKTGKQA